MPTAKKVTKKPVKKAVKKSAAKTAVKKVAAKKTVTKSTPAKKKTVAPKKQTVTKKPVKKGALKKAPAKKVAPKKPTTPKTPIKKVIVKNIVKQPTIKEDLMTNTMTMDDLDIDVAPYEMEKGADYMTEEQLEHFRKILLRWKHQLMQEVDSTVGHMQEDGLSYPDPIDRASQEEGFNLELRTRDRERKLIKKIESSIDNIESGEYGYCADCGAEIGIRRLEARPTADKCIDCKTYEEIREKQAGGM